MTDFERARRHPLVRKLAAAGIELSHDVLVEIGAALRLYAERCPGEATLLQISENGRPVSLDQMIEALTANNSGDPKVAAEVPPVPAGGEEY